MANLSELEAEAARIAAELKAAKKLDRANLIERRRAFKAFGRWRSKYCKAFTLEEESHATALFDGLSK